MGKRPLDIGKRLARLGERHPILSPAIKALPRSLIPTPRFLEAYVSSKAPHAIRTLVLRVLFEEPQVYSEPIDSYRVDEAIFLRWRKSQ